MIRIEKLNAQAGEFQLRDVTLEVPSRKYAVVMGRTGSGKTTLLEAIAGLQPITSGRITLHDRDVTRLGPAERNIGYVPQDGALFTSMTVGQHLAFALHIRRRANKEIEQRVKELAGLLGIELLLERKIHGLSGGEKQRVALGRALSYDPHTLLLDEPLSALDDQTRVQMYELLKRVQAETQVTILHVTHSNEEAETLADCRFHCDKGIVTIESTDDEPAQPDEIESPAGG